MEGAPSSQLLPGRARQALSSNCSASFSSKFWSVPKIAGSGIARGSRLHAPPTRSGARPRREVSRRRGGRSPPKRRRSDRCSPSSVLGRRNAPSAIFSFAGFGFSFAFACFRSFELAFVCLFFAFVAFFFDFVFLGFRRRGDPFFGFAFDCFQFAFFAFAFFDFGLASLFRFNGFFGFDGFDVFGLAGSDFRSVEGLAPPSPARAPQIRSPLLSTPGTSSMIIVVG